MFGMMARLLPFSLAPTDAVAQSFSVCGEQTETHADSCHIRFVRQHQTRGQKEWRARTETPTIVRESWNHGRWMNIHSIVKVICECV